MGHVPANVQFQRKFEGMLELLEGSIGDLKLKLRIEDEIGRHWFDMGNHPLGLSIPDWIAKDPVANAPMEWVPTVYIGHFDDTMLNTSLFIKYITLRLTELQHPPNRKIFLRVTYGQCSGTYPNHHHLYYELGFHGHHAITTGMTDCSGTGRNGKKALDKVFEFLAEMFQTQIERADLGLINAEHKRKLLFDYINAQA
jgi:hypothetical protein